MFVSIQRKAFRSLARLLSVVLVNSLLCQPSAARRETRCGILEDISLRLHSI